MAPLTCWIKSSTTSGSSESSNERSIDLSLAKLCSSFVAGGGIHSGTKGLPGKLAEGGLKGAAGAMTRCVRRTCVVVTDAADIRRYSYAVAPYAFIQVVR